MSVENGPKSVGDIVDRVHAGHFAGGDQRGQHCPVLCAGFIAGKKCIFSRKSYWADLVLDRVGVQLKRAVLEEADQAGPMCKGVADVLGQLGFLRNAGELGLQPRLERGDDRCRMVAPSSKAQCRILSSDRLLDLIKQCNLAQHLLRNR